MLKYSLGIDVSAPTLACCLSSIDFSQHVQVVATSSFANSTSGWKALHNWIAKHRKQKDIPLVCILEATGVYYEGCALYLSNAQYYVSVVLPNKSKKYMESLGLKSKNDKIDARGLARMAAEQALDQWQPMSAFFFTLRTMTRQLERLQKTKTSLSNQLHATQISIYQVGVVTRQLTSLIRTLEKQMGSLEKAIANHLMSDPDIADKVAHLCSIKGVGLTTVAVMLAETNGFALMENIPQLVSYSGYDVVEDQSGKRIGKTKISKKGNARIRKALYFPAITTVNCQVSPFYELFHRTHSKHHIKMKSYVAVQKKLLILMYTLWKKNEPYKEMVPKKEDAESGKIMQPENKIKRKFPTRGREPVGKLLHEVTISFEME
ncbi:IS110 family transposase [Synechococcus sp. UW179B]|uniref:IS110 family transposase n=1 Tax=Synechococcus sp. UW179B TaxID=2575516 RepID=UPI000E0EE345|nr:IS110 family transposase [Synechococcus sp. UW179B]